MLRRPKARKEALDAHRNAEHKAEIWVLITEMPDPVLNRALSGVLPLPNHNWSKIPIP